MGKSQPWTMIGLFICMTMLFAMPSKADSYNAQFWLWRVEDGDISVPEAAAYGFDGIVTSLAYINDSNSDMIDYYFNSPTLSAESWATHVTNRVESYVAQAHANGMKLATNAEDINPYRWTRGPTVYTPAIMEGMVTELGNIGVDRWFDECFDIWPNLAHAIATKTSSLGMEHQDGTDPSHIYQIPRDGDPQGWDYPTLDQDTNPISMYDYALDRDDPSLVATLYQEGALGYGFANTWGKRKSMVYCMYDNWGIPAEYWPGVMRSSMLIAALQHRVDDFVLIGSAYKIRADHLNLPALETWINGYIQKQDDSPDKPVMNIVVHLKATEDGTNWMGLVLQSDAITWAALQSGYNIKCSTEPLPDADAYYVATRGYDWENGTLDLTPEIVALFSGSKPVILQCLYGMPFNDLGTDRWRTVLNKIGINSNSGGISHTETMPETGTYNGVSFKMTGYDTREDWWRERVGTLIDSSKVSGSVIADANGVPLIMGKNKKYFVAGAYLSWQVSSVLARCLTYYNWGTAVDSDVWGVAGPAVTAVIATNDTELEMYLPGIDDGSKLHVVEYDKMYNTTYEDTITYVAPFTRTLQQYDMVVINTTNLIAPPPPQISQCICSEGMASSYLMGIIIVSIGVRRWAKKKYSRHGGNPNPQSNGART